MLGAGRDAGLDEKFVIGPDADLGAALSARRDTSLRRISAGAVATGAAAAETTAGTS